MDKSVKAEKTLKACDSSAKAFAADTNVEIQTNSCNTQLTSGFQIHTGENSYCDLEAKKLCLPPFVPSFATIVQQRKSFDTAEKFVQTDLSSTSLFSASKISVSTLTDDKICNVTRPPKKKKAKQYNNIDSNENVFVSEFRDSNTFVQDTTELPCSTNPLRESILTDSLLPDDAESDDFIDYDPEETIDEDMINDLRHQPSTSRTITNPRFYSTFKKKYVKHRRKKKKS
ncbi:hypothetical protein HNY73_011446 [Argiope bruennichi]|uniref:Uncharacterized protein n=1 Tax=Argiope bruennichi TaxID=94029 RepID=A0A8T0F6U5_ARGBR|nr:hypothetical protein HNY73_011446 [Argiope bruennichi]